MQAISGHPKKCPGIGNSPPTTAGAFQFQRPRTRPRHLPRSPRGPPRPARTGRPEGEAPGGIRRRPVARSLLRQGVRPDLVAGSAEGVRRRRRAGQDRATATAGTSSASRCCWPGGWSRRACGWSTSTGCGTTTARAARATTATAIISNWAKTELLPPTDAAFASLVEDLADRGLLDETLVVDDGRVRPHAAVQHATAAATTGRGASAPCWPAAASAGGQVYGASDKIAAYPTQTRFAAGPDGHALPLPRHRPAHDDPRPAESAVHPRRGQADRGAAVACNQQGMASGLMDHAWDGGVAGESDAIVKTARIYFDCNRFIRRAVPVAAGTCR